MNEQSNIKQRLLNLHNYNVCCRFSPYLLAVTITPTFLGILTTRFCSMDVGICDHSATRKLVGSGTDIV